MKQLSAHSALCVFSVSFIAISCQTVRERESHAEGQVKKSNPDAQLAVKAVKSFSGVLRDVEVDFLKRECSKTLENGLQAETLVGGEKLPLFANLAYRVCAAEADPKNGEKERAALGTIDEFERYNAHPFNSAFLEKLRAERFIAMGDKTSALAAKRREREYLRQQARDILRIDMQILELTEGSAALTAPQLEKFREIATLAQDDTKIFDALHRADDLVNDVKDEPAHDIVSEQRAFIVARIEQLFAQDASLLEGKKAKASPNDVQSFADDLKKKYPTKNYEVRIDAIVSGSALPQPKIESPEGNASPTATPEALSDDAKAEKAISDARTALDAGDPGKAVDILDALPDTARTDKTRRLRKDASEVHVRELRIKVKDLYTRAKAQSDKKDKIETLKQSIQVLEQILQRYPDTNARSSIERNIKSINSEIQELGKTKQ